MINDKQKTTSVSPSPTSPVPQWSEVSASVREVEATFGFVPSFMENISPQAVPGAWQEVKNLYFNPNTSLEPKLKHLIGLAIGTQIPCARVRYFEEKFSEQSQISPQEQREAVLMAAITRHWSTVLNGSLMDKSDFRKEADQIMKYVEEQMKSMGNKMPDESLFLVQPTDPNEAYNDMKKTLGRIPMFFQVFPKVAIAGAWSEFKGLQLNPRTALSGKEKELIGLAVASQIPCDYCIYFHRSAARLNGATEDEMNEAIAMAALTRHWSAIFHAGTTTQESFQRDADRMISSSAQTRLHS